LGGAPRAAKGTPAGPGGRDAVRRCVGGALGSLGPAQRRPRGSKPLFARLLRMKSHARAPSARAYLGTPHAVAAHDAHAEAVVRVDQRLHGRLHALQRGVASKPDDRVYVRRVVAEAEEELRHRRQRCLVGVAGRRPAVGAATRGWRRRARHLRVQRQGGWLSGGPRRGGAGRAQLARCCDAPRGARRLMLDRAQRRAQTLAPGPRRLMAPGGARCMRGTGPLGASCAAATDSLGRFNATSPLPLAKPRREQHPTPTGPAHGGGAGPLGAPQRPRSRSP
jgi:hypothetical protein